ncbi:aminoacyl-tRNA hydrolase [Undibacterium sp. Ren11W]|uniref:aminoacyl-tRNA hydrolase n=1 Tax=Undibacterium sp. Ren11W TaxID=3413045 RepID=UPI003BF006B8
MAQGIFSLAKTVLLTNLKRVQQAVHWRTRTVYEYGLHSLTRWHRKQLNHTIFVGITGSAGKTTTKDLIAGILTSHFSDGNQTSGTLNTSEYTPATILGTRRSDAFCVVEISGHRPREMDLPLSLVRPTVGVVTNIGFDHISAFKTREAIALEKSKLIRGLGVDGIAVLNADDALVMQMAEHCVGRVVSFGVSASATLRAEQIQSVWPARLSLKVIWEGETVTVHTQLCGKHWAPAVLAALATGLALGVPLAVAVAAIAAVSPFEGRMQPVQVNDITFIRDDWKAPFSSIAPACDFMREAKAARKIIVIGTISDYFGDRGPRYLEAARLSLASADCIIFVGSNSSAALRAKKSSADKLFAFPTIQDAENYLATYLMAGDLVLLKGSAKADHLQRLLLARTSTVQCWRSDCHLNQFCLDCGALYRSAQAPTKQVSDASSMLDSESEKISQLTSSTWENTPISSATRIVLGLGNPDLSLLDTPHNVGYRALDVLALELGREWQSGPDAEGLASFMFGEFHGTPVCLLKIACPMNLIGPHLLKLSGELGFHPVQCILLHDDLDLPFGVTRMRLRGSDGGHKGVRSILQAFQDDQFCRVKIGIGKGQPGQTVADYVLTAFPSDQQAQVAQLNRDAADKVIELLQK